VVLLRSFVGSAKWTTTSGMTREICLCTRGCPKLPRVVATHGQSGDVDGDLRATTLRCGIK
jgi:hypothetical protein